MIFLFYILIGVGLFVSKIKTISLVIYEKTDEISKDKPYSGKELFKVTITVAFIITMFTWPYWLIKWINK